MLLFGSRRSGMRSFLGSSLFVVGHDAGLGLLDDDLLLDDDDLLLLALGVVVRSGRRFRRLLGFRFSLGLGLLYEVGFLLLRIVGIVRHRFLHSS